MDVAAVFTKVDSNLVSSVLNADSQCHQRVGIIDFSGLSQDGYMVYIDTECDTVDCGHSDSLCLLLIE